MNISFPPPVDLVEDKNLLPNPLEEDLSVPPSPPDISILRVYESNLIASATSAEANE